VRDHSEVGTGAGELRRRLYREAEIEAERLLALVRIVVALLLAGTLATALVAVEEPPPEVRLQLLVAFPLLAAYLAVGIWSHRLAVPGRFRDWMPWAFTAADAALVLFNVATTVINLNAPVTALWVFPAAWLAPIVLAFGVLRYRASLQAAAGVVLVAGFCFILLGLGDDAQALSAIVPLLQLPPTIVRVTMLTLLAALLTFAAIKRRALLERAIDETSRRTNLARYLPPEIAALLAAGDVERLRQGWEAEVALLIVDIRGFTARAEALPNPAAVSAFLGRFRAHVVEVAAATGGVVDKFVGDNAILVFGVPEPRPGDTARALACARSLIQRIAQWNREQPPGGPVRIGIGAHCGRVFAGAVGDPSRLEFTVLGDPVNVTARLEQLTKEVGAELLASRALVDRAGETAGWRLLPAIALRGRAEPIEVLAWDASTDAA
jgi:adenylate cyclase